MSEKIVPGSDLDINVINAYQLTCQAEAQEVTIARAIELKHNSSLISSLAHHTLVMFTKASTLIKSLKNKMFNKWLAYLELKAAVYESYVSIIVVVMNQIFGIDIHNLDYYRLIVILVNHYWNRKNVVMQYDHWMKVKNIFNVQKNYVVNIVRLKNK